MLLFDNMHGLRVLSIVDPMVSHDASSIKVDDCLDITLRNYTAATCDLEMTVPQYTLDASGLQYQLFSATAAVFLWLILAVCPEKFLSMAGLFLYNVFAYLRTDPGYCPLMSIDGTCY